jgi:hypothetical protein
MAVIRRGGRWRTEERRKMAMITGGEEDGDLRRGGRWLYRMGGGWRPEGRKMANIEDGIKIANTKGRKQRMRRECVEGEG